MVEKNQEVVEEKKAGKEPSEAEKIVKRQAALLAMCWKYTAIGVMHHAKHLKKGATNADAGVIGELQMPTSEDIRNMAVSLFISVDRKVKV